MKLEIDVKKKERIIQKYKAEFLEYFESKNYVSVDL